MNRVPSASLHVCVFCGSSDGAKPEYLLEAIQLGRCLAAAGWGLVYGGASVGLMGAVADAALTAGAEVIGVLPEALAAKEIAHSNLTELHIVGSMHERKAKMASLSDAFIALPGGYGTLDEFLEILTWAQLEIHRNPCILVNTDGYYDRLLSFLDHAVEQGFLRAANRSLLVVAKDAEQAITLIRAAAPQAAAQQEVGSQAEPLLQRQPQLLP
ncbi:MAG TPA: TIGR00730 family Rossman fold protein [Acidisarcina sp.]|nr:TIGR00730 family Rossman fold protein [Acidisarcina sp.]